MKQKPMAEAMAEALRPGALDDGAPGMSSEQEQDAAALAAMVADAGSPVTITGEPVPEPEPGPQKMDAVESLAGLLGLAAPVLEFAGLKNTAAVWNADTCRTGAERIVPVLKKYPWGARVLDFLETGAGVEEVALALFALPVALATGRAWRADADAIAAARARPVKEPEPGGAPDAS